MTNPKMPVGLGPGGRALWSGIADEHELNASQVAQLTEACRMKDRCDKLDDLLRGDVDTWATLDLDPRSNGQVYELRITGALSKANDTANAMKQQIAALRLPDEVTGKRPQRRGPRGAQKPSVAGGAGKVSSLDRARQRQSG